MATLTVHLFGRLAISCDGAAINGLVSRKVQELLCYLILHRHRPHQRECLASTLWSNTPTAQSRANLRKVLWKLQSVFSDAGAVAPIAIGGEWIQVGTEGGVWCDVSELELAFQQVTGAASDAISEACAQRAEQAIGLYRGELLEGWYQDWCLFERERLQNIYLALLDKLMAYYERRGQLEAAIAHGNTILRYDRARELTHRHLMRLLVLAGDRTGALRQYERCAHIMREELDTGPSEPTLALFEQIRADRSPASYGPATDELLRAQSHLESLLPRLAQLQRESAAIWGEMKESLHAIEHILNGHPH